MMLTIKNSSHDHVMSFVFSSVYDEPSTAARRNLGSLKILLAILPHCSSLLSLYIAAFDGFALVVVFLALTEGDDELDIAAAGEEFGGDDGVAVFLAGGELLDLSPLRQKLTCARADGPGVWLALLVVAQREAGVIEPQLTIANCHICPLELHMALAGRADL